MAASSSRSLDEVYSSLSISEEEEFGLEVGADIVGFTLEDLKLSLMGKLLTDKPIKFQFLKDTMAATWRPGKGVCIKELGYNLFIFQFFHEVDVERILDDGPWSFERNMLLLHILKDNESPFHIQLTMTEFWIQVHSLPSNFHIERIFEAIGAHLGEYVKADHSKDEDPWKMFIRLRVRIDVTKPLKRRMKLRRSGGDWFWVDFRYERLPTFCFICGMLGHADRFCPKLFEGASMESEKPYGGWTRATGRRPQAALGERWLVQEGTRRPVIVSTEQYGKDTLVNRMGSGCHRNRVSVGGEVVRDGVSGVQSEEHVADESTETITGPTVESNNQAMDLEPMYLNKESPEGMELVEQKRKRSKEDNPLLHAVSSFGSSITVSKNECGAGSALQTRQES